MVRESTREDTWNAIRAGMFALINPVMTSTEGRWVATIRWMPAARAFCAKVQWDQGEEGEVYGLQCGIAEGLHKAAGQHTKAMGQ